MLFNALRSSHIQSCSRRFGLQFRSHQSTTDAPPHLAQTQLRPEFLFHHVARSLRRAARTAPFHASFISAASAKRASAFVMSARFNHSPINGEKTDASNFPLSWRATIVSASPSPNGGFPVLSLIHI